jgi:2',3'-cyclic-nucleotide 2'-phosphodiesterase (5'-nucleotidase family)
MQLSRTIELTLVHTNDLHCNLERWPYTAAVVRAELARAEAAGRPAIYLDAGDFSEMSHPVCYGTRGEVTLRLLSALGCSAMTPGNNEIMRTYRDTMTALASRSPFPWVCANLRDLEGRQLPGLRDWTIIPAGPLKLGIVGATDPYTATYRLLGLRGAPPADEIRRSAAEVRAAGADLVVLLSHLGLGLDQELVGAGLGVDLVVGGHTHSVVPEPVVIVGVPIAQAGGGGEYVGVLNLTVDTETGRIATCHGQLVPVDMARLTPDPATVRCMDEITQAAEAEMDRLITDLPMPLPHDGLGESALCTLAAEAARRRAGAEIGLMVGAGAVRGLPAGPLRRRHLLEAMPAFFVMARLELTGRTLQTILEQSQDPGVYRTESGAGGQRPYGLPIGRVFTAGLTYRVDGGRVVDLCVGGEPVDPDRVYTAGGPSLMRYAQSGYPAFAEVAVAEYFVPELVREALETALCEGLPVA